MRGFIQQRSDDRKMCNLNISVLYKNRKLILDKAFGSTPTTE